MKYRWMLLVGLVSLLVVVAGCGLTPGESLAGNARATGRNTFVKEKVVVPIEQRGCYYDNECASSQECQGAKNAANPAYSEKGSCMEKVIPPVAVSCPNGFKCGDIPVIGNVNEVVCGNDKPAHEWQCTSSGSWQQLGLCDQNKYPACNVLTGKIKEPAKMATSSFCMQGYVKKVKGTGMPGEDCPSQFNSYSCEEGISVPKNACPVGSNFYYTQDALYYEWFKNSPLDENGNLINNHYFCVSDKVFKPEDLTCAKGFKLTEQWGYNDNPWDFSSNKPKYEISATDPSKAASCIQHKATTPGETECLKKGWIFRCDIIDSEKPKEQPEQYMGTGLDNKFPCGTSRAKVIGGMGMGYCCGYQPQ